MKLDISQIVLEEARFNHIGKFLEQEPTQLPGRHTFNIEVNVLDVQEENEKAVVRLKVKSDEEGQYSFLASYLMLYRVEAEGADTDDLAERRRQIAVTGAMMLMPFVRECVADLTSRGRFGPVWLPPMNFGESLKEGKPPEAPKRKRARKTSKQGG